MIYNLPHSLVISTRKRVAEKEVNLPFQSLAATVAVKDPSDGLDFYSKN